jgi:hypothetical protein
MPNNGHILPPFPVRFGAFGYIAATGFVYFLAQVAVGTDFRVAVLFSLAIVFGLGAVHAGGGLRSAFGLLNAILLALFLPIAIFLKVLMLEPADSNLQSPLTTSFVMAFGFLALWIATALARRFPRPKKHILPSNYSARDYLVLSVVVLVLSFAGYLIGISPDLEGQGLRTGGILGYARGYAAFTSFAIIPAMFYVWKSNSKRFLSHPLVLGILLLQTALGILNTGKQQAIEPLALFGLTAVMRFGFASRKVWALGIVGAIFYVGLVYPYSQYIRFNGGREGNAFYRVENIQDTVWRLLTDPNFRSMVSTRIESRNNLYWNSPSLAPFSRLAMVCEADRLIAATERTRSFTGWETITWGFKLMTPSVILPNKPIFGANNYLAHIAGDAAIRNTDTQWAYGVFANFYNAFGLAGVFLGSLVLFTALYYWLGLFFGNPSWAAAPVASSLNLLFLIGAFHHSLAESSVSNQIASFATPVLILSMILLARGLARIFPKFPDRILLHRQARIHRLRADRVSRLRLPDTSAIPSSGPGKQGL